MTDVQMTDCRICGTTHPRGLGATAMPRILGLVPKTNALDVYHWYTRPSPEGWWEDETIDQKRGHILEPLAAAEYRHQADREVEKSEGPTTHPDYPAFLGYR